MQTVTHKELAEIMQPLNHATPAGLIAKTIPNMRKTNNPYFGRVYKITHVNGIIGHWNYEASVNRQRDREGLTPDFVAAPRSWGERQRGTPFVTHKGNLYVEIKCERAVKTVYYLDGVEVSDEETLTDIKSWEPKKKEGTRQQVENPTVCRDFTLENILQIRFNGDIFHAVAETKEEAEIA